MTQIPRANAVLRTCNPGIPFRNCLIRIILKTVSWAPLHGYGIAQRIEAVSGNVFKINPGSLLTALRRLERAGLLDSEWKKTANSRKAKYYALTPAGQKHLASERRDWERRAGAVTRLLAVEG